jgi:hypothetical protein
VVQVLELEQEQEQEQEQDFVGLDAAPVRWEPCASVSALDETGVCAGCGWPEDDHGAVPVVAGAVVIPVPRRERPRLRRAS